MAPATLDRIFRIALPASAFLVGSTVLAVGWFTQTGRFARGFAPEQPIPFSHRLHAGTMKIPCPYCHSGARRSRHAGVPSVQVCMNCHAVTRTDSPPIRRLADLFREGRPLPWERVHLLPDHVYFDHRPHVNAGIACQVCHGEVQLMERVSQHMSVRMGNCLGCHRDPGPALPAKSPVKRGPEHCNACHR